MRVEGILLRAVGVESLLGKAYLVGTFEVAPTLLLSTLSFQANPLIRKNWFSGNLLFAKNESRSFAFLVLTGLNGPSTEFNRGNKIKTLAGKSVEKILFTVRGTTCVEPKRFLI